jgi:Phage integrase, N-terminal SAM-like domain
MAAISPLRRRMIDGMMVRNLFPSTQQSYIYAVAKFSRRFDRSPDRLGLEDVRAYQLHLITQKRSWSHINQTVCALRFFYGVTQGGKDRYVMLSPQLLRILRAYWRLARPGRWLFPGQDAGVPIITEGRRIARQRCISVIAPLRMRPVLPRCSTSDARRLRTGGRWANAKCERPYAHSNRRRRLTSASPGCGRRHSPASGRVRWRDERSAAVPSSTAEPGALGEPSPLT